MGFFFYIYFCVITSLEVKNGLANKRAELRITASLPLECEPGRVWGDLRCISLHDCTDFAFFLS